MLPFTLKKFILYIEMSHCYVYKNTVLGFHLLNMECFSMPLNKTLFLNDKPNELLVVPVFQN